MAALLRHGARRVGGSALQRTQAAFTTPAAAAERRLLTTEVQRTQAASTTPAAGGERCLPTEHARPRSHKDLRAVSCEIEVLKEDLYNLLSVMEVSSLPMNYQNRQLFKFLSAQVKPRPDEFQWREMRSSRIINDVIEKTIFVSTCMLGFEVWYWMARGKEAQTAKQR